MNISALPNREPWKLRLPPEQKTGTSGGQPAIRYPRRHRPGRDGQYGRNSLWHGLRELLSTGRAQASPVGQAMYPGARPELASDAETV